MNDAAILKLARERVAGRYHHAYHRNTILRGGWDAGDLVKREIEAIAAEQIRRAEEASDTE